MKSISECKVQVIKDLIRNEELLKLIDSEQSDYEIADPISIIYCNIFPCHLVPTLQTKADSYLLVEVEEVEGQIQVLIQVLCHVAKNKLRAKNATRVDAISEELKNMFVNTDLSFVSNKTVSLIAKPITINVVFDNSFSEKAEQYYMKWLERQSEQLESNISVLKQNYICREVVFKMNTK